MDLFFLRLGEQIQVFWGENQKKVLQVRLFGVIIAIEDATSQGFPTSLRYAATCVARGFWFCFCVGFQETGLYVWLFCYL